jgi:tRNA A37 threonylcarbamoyladenosine modification protein TsaB
LYEKEQLHYNRVKTAKNIRGSQIILQTIEELLRKNHLQIQDIDEITTHPGPGSYTGLRVGASIANTLAFCLDVSINQKPQGEFVYPTYE